MKITGFTALAVAAILAAGCSSNPSTPDGAEADEVAETSTRRRSAGCPDGYAPVGTRIKRCRAVGGDTRVVGGDAVRNNSPNTASSAEGGVTGRGVGGPPQD